MDKFYSPGVVTIGGNIVYLENRDGNGTDTLALKQALALLLTINRTPQLYYGTEVLMNGTKEVTDGNVRKDFPGGFPGDKKNCFTREGCTNAKNAMFEWCSRLLHWRQGNEVVTNGRMVRLDKNVTLRPRQTMVLEF